MDIIDIMLAKAMTPQGQTDTYVAKANAAAAKAEKAEEDAAAAIATVTAASEDIAAAQEAAAQLLEDAQDVLETAQAAQINTLDTEDVDAEIKKLDVSVNVIDSPGSKLIQAVTTYPDNTLNTENITRLYKATGSNEDGTMTQKAITEALATKATQTYVDNAIASIPTSNSSGSTIEMNASDAGHLVKVDNNGHLVASLATEDALIEALFQSGAYTLENTLGLDIDYTQRTFTRTQDAVNKSMGSDFNGYTMYGGRTRCNVADDGTINAFYGDNNYTEDGSNGQVMVYQPKFYYKRVIRQADEIAKGKIVRHETLLLSDTAQAGFKLAPIFNNDLDYVLLPAFDAGLVNDKLVSIAGVSPINNITINEAEAYANARGNGWHIMNMAAISANQMLEIVEFGSMNGQNSIESGITYAPSSSGTFAFITGSTGILGNTTGHATSTTALNGANTLTMTEAGYRAISYRGMENPWGSIWQMIGGIKIEGNGAKGGGAPLICTDFNYTSGTYEDIGFNLPSIYGWINAMGFGSDKYDWVYIPIECSNSANSLAPVGDGLWTIANLNGSVHLVIGGSYGFKEECGPFYYGADRATAETAKYNYGAKLLYIPTKNATYNTNINKWNTYMGG